MVLLASPNHASSGQRRRCSSTNIDIDHIALMQCPSVLSAPTLMGYFYSLNAILQPPHTTRRQDVVVAATLNQTSSGHRRACTTSPMAIDMMALMLCPSILSAPTLMGYNPIFYSILSTTSNVSVDTLCDGGNNFC